MNSLLRNNCGYHRRVQDTIYVSRLRKFITVNKRYFKHGLAWYIDVSTNTPQRSEQQERRLWRESIEGMAEEALLASFCF